ncbi:MAG: triose-phosphate isomerase [Candidatus Jacksonbacteria bacterium]
MKYLIANWKMKLSPMDEIELAQNVSKINFDANKITISLNPSFLSLAKIAEIIKNTGFETGAQDCFWEDSGAFTGEISPQFLRDIGCQNVIIGHSERRDHIGESDTIINKKIRAIIDCGLTPILCVGESAEQKHSGSKDHIVRRQVELGLHNINLVGFQKLMIAYEPIWAIGTGRPADISDITYMHQVIYQTLIDLFPKSIVQNNTFVLYGGSVDPSNAGSFLRKELIDGVLIGGASLKIDEFTKIIQIADSL